MSVRTAERVEFLTDVVICFVEDFGTNPWRQIVGGTYDPDKGVARFIDIEGCTGGPEDEDYPSYDVTIETVAKGIGRLVRGEVRMGNAMLANIKEANAENDAGMIDAYDADAIVQAGVFGELVYG